MCFSHLWNFKPFTKYLATCLSLYTISKQIFIRRKYLDTVLWDCGENRFVISRLTYCNFYLFKASEKKAIWAKISMIELGFLNESHIGVVIRIFCLLVMVIFGVKKFNKPQD